MGKVEQKVRELAAKYPDFVYQRPKISTCNNLLGGDPKYPDLKGCIIGQAVRACGYRITDTYSAAPVAALLRVLQVNEPVYWLAEVQSLQDSGYTWGYAVKRADAAPNRHSLSLPQFSISLQTKRIL